MHTCSYTRIMNNFILTPHMNNFILKCICSLYMYFKQTPRARSLFAFCTHMPVTHEYMDTRVFKHASEAYSGVCKSSTHVCELPRVSNAHTNVLKTHLVWWVCAHRDTVHHFPYRHHLLDRGKHPKPPHFHHAKGSKPIYK